MTLSFFANSSCKYCIILSETAVSRQSPIRRYFLQNSAYSRVQLNVSCFQVPPLAALLITFICTASQNSHRPRTQAADFAPLPLGWSGPLYSAHALSPPPCACSQRSCRPAGARRAASWWPRAVWCRSRTPVTCVTATAAGSSASGRAARRRRGSAR